MASSLPPTDPFNPLAALNPSQRHRGGKPLTPTGGGTIPSSGGAGGGGLPPVVSGQGDTARDWAKDTAAGIEHVEMSPPDAARGRGAQVKGVGAGVGAGVGGGGGGGGQGGGQEGGGLDPMEAQPGVRGVDRGGVGVVSPSSTTAAAATNTSSTTTSGTAIGAKGAKAGTEHDEEVQPPGAYIHDETADGGMRAPEKDEKRGSLLDTVKEYLPERVVEYLPGIKPTELPTKEHPSTSHGGVGSLPGNISEASVAKLPDERIEEGSIPDPRMEVLGAEKGMGDMPSVTDSSTSPGAGASGAPTTAGDDTTQHGHKARAAAAGAGVAGGIATVGAGVWNGTTHVLSEAGHVLGSYLPSGHHSPESTWTHEPTSLPSSETPDISSVGVGSLPGTINEEGVAKLPEERMKEQMPSRDDDYEAGMGKGVGEERGRTGGVGKLPGEPGEGGVAVLPEERGHPESEIYGSSKKPVQLNAHGVPTSTTSPTTVPGTTAPGSTAAPGSIATPQTDTTNPNDPTTRNLGIGAGVATGAGLGAAAYGKAMTGASGGKDGGEVPSSGKGSSGEGGGGGGGGGGGKESFIQKVKHKVTGGLSPSEPTTAPTSSTTAATATTGADVRPQTRARVPSDNEVRSSGRNDDANEPRSFGGDEDGNEPSAAASATDRGRTGAGVGKAEARDVVSDSGVGGAGAEDATGEGVGAGYGTGAGAGSGAGRAGVGGGLGEGEATAEPGGGSTYPGTKPDVGGGDEGRPAVGTQALVPSAGDTSAPHSTTSTSPSAGAAAGAGLGLGAAGAGGAAAATTTSPSTMPTSTSSGAHHDTGKHDPDTRDTPSSGTSGTGGASDDVSAGSTEHGEGRHARRRSSGQQEGKIKFMNKLKGEAKVLSGKIGRDERKIEEGKRMLGKE